MDSAREHVMRVCRGAYGEERKKRGGGSPQIKQTCFGPAENRLDSATHLFDSMSTIIVSIRFSRTSRGICPAVTAHKERHENLLTRAGKALRMSYASKKHNGNIDYKNYVVASLRICVRDLTKLLCDSM